MEITNVTEYDKMTDDYNNISSSKFTLNENKVDIFIPTILITVPCGLSFLCFLSLMIYTLIKPSLNNK